MRSTPTLSAGREKEFDRLIIDNISFKYNPLESYIIKDFSLTVKKGERVAITGFSGSGKTTLIKMVLGLYAPLSGKILFSDNSSKSILCKSKIGSVMQEDKLIAGSILDNIKFFRQVEDSKVLEICQKINLHKEINQMPMKYNTVVSSSSEVISSGQKQRILIARALVSTPSLLLLDEATNNLDAYNKKIILDLLTKNNITTLIASHRKSTIDACSRVVSLHKLI